MPGKLKYGITTLNGYMSYSHSEGIIAVQKRLTPEQNLLFDQWIVCCEELPEMEFDTLEAAVEAMKERYADKLEPVESESGTWTLSCYVLDSNHNLVAAMNKDKTCIFTWE